MNKKVYLLLACLCPGITSYEQVIDKKESHIYADQKKIANDLQEKASLVPVKLPDAKSMVSINESGDGIISLPLVTAKGRKLSLPISASYVTSGIKVNQSSSEIGLGWSINSGSITRDYGAYEPDYTYTGPEFKMLNDNGSVHDKHLQKTTWSYSVTASGHGVYYKSGYTDHVPINQNKVLEYDMADGKAPDNYQVSIPGVASNDFWDAKPLPGSGAPPSPGFVFSQAVPWTIDYATKVFSFSQEISRINEMNYEVNSSTGNLQGSLRNMAAAIAFYPYVKGQQYANLIIEPTTGGINVADFVQSSDMLEPSPYTTIKYEDYSSFTITISDGTKYVFGRPLRGQKYLYNEEPFWSAMKAGPYTTSGPTNLIYNEFWKTDFIAEWLLTEVRSNDYVDVNGNGPDDADKGDWIKIDYTDPIQGENIPGVYACFLPPKHREFLNFTQTDRQSSIWRERAYVTTITTPVQKISFDNSERFDVNHDYFPKVFNRIFNSYVLDNKLVDGVGYGSVGYTDASGFHLPTVIDDRTKVNYPIELRRYDKIDVRENLTAANDLVQNIKLNYAAKGSSQELAVSNNLIIDNSYVPTPYNPGDLGSGITPSTFSKATGRGKTTLLGIDYRGNSYTGNKISYSFDYNYNPPFSNIHLFEIYQRLSSPTMREALRDDPRWTGLRTLNLSPSPAPPYYIPYSISPWKTIMVDPTWNAPSSDGYHVPFIATENNNDPIYEDEFGYYFDDGMTNKGRHAWSLSKINLPYGGSVAIEYERDQFNGVVDRSNWPIPDYCLPDVGHYNNVAHLRSQLQQVINKSFTFPAAYVTDPSIGWGYNLVRLYKEYYFVMNDYSGGLRVKQLDIADNFVAPTVTKKYLYGDGHFTAPPADYYENYMKGFSEFMTSEFKRHGNMDPTTSYLSHFQYENYGTSSLGIEYSEYRDQMMRLSPHMRIDNSYRRSAKHYYEFIEELNGDNSKTRWRYGKLNVASPSASRLSYIPMSYGILKQGGDNDRHNFISLLSSDLGVDCFDVGNYATEYVNNASIVVKKTEEQYSYTQIATNSITTLPYGLSSGIYHPYMPAIFEPLIGPVTYLGLHPIPSPSLMYPYTGGVTGRWSGAPLRFLHENVSTSLLSNVGYLSGSSYAGTYSSVAEAKNPLMKIGAQTGLYIIGLPPWFTPITGTPAVWSTPYSSGSVKTEMANGINYTISENYDKNQNHFYYQDGTIAIPGTSFKSHKSYKLNPSQTVTTTNF